jgi:hypothetical protein
MKESDQYIDISKMNLYAISFIQHKISDYRKIQKVQQGNIDRNLRNFWFEFEHWIDKIRPQNSKSRLLC